MEIKLKNTVGELIQSNQRNKEHEEKLLVTIGELKNYERKITDYKKDYDQLFFDYNALKNEYSFYQASYNETYTNLHKIEMKLNQTEAKLNEIYGSKGFRLLQKIWRVIYHIRKIK